MGIAQRAFNQEMHDSKLPTVRVDMGETLPLDYNPVHVKKDVKDGTLMIGIKTSGLTPYDSNRAYMLGDGAYQLIDLSSGKVVWQGEDKGTTYTPEAGQDQVLLIHGDKKVQNRVSHKTSVQYRKIGTLKELPAGDYAFKGSIVFSKYGFPIEKADFVLSENVATDKGWVFVLASLAGLFFGFFLIFITVPPHMRTKGEAK